MTGNSIFRTVVIRKMKSFYARSWVKSSPVSYFFTGFLSKKWFETIEIHYSAFVDAYGGFFIFGTDMHAKSTI